MTGASASGHDGETVLATITFQCKGEGTSSLELIVSVFADATIGDPQDIDPLTVMSGEFACKDAPPPTDEPPVDDTEEPPDDTQAPPPPTALPPTGSGPNGNGGSGTAAWFIVALAAAGLAGIAGFGALRLRRN